MDPVASPSGARGDFSQKAGLLEEQSPQCLTSKKVPAPPDVPPPYQGHCSHLRSLKHLFIGNWYLLKLQEGVILLLDCNVFMFRTHAVKLWVYLDLQVFLLHSSVDFSDHLSIDETAFSKTVPLLIWERDVMAFPVWG